jgi:hypothetical protein
MASYQQVATNNPMRRSCNKFAPSTLPANKLPPPSISEMILQHLENTSSSIRKVRWNPESGDDEKDKKEYHVTSLVTAQAKW